ncbi:AAA family ATPase [Janthinobacterium sp. SUN073]|uniref:AAA family ATPase n=1 Tax=unclassified Janthinobacterium TaxID=2610881 RepID=UPI0025AEFBFC|nr:AAA family ATPase [Janthinobacterium sp. SUN073]MDN2699941.1 AAA family ATPase [Janthinobacterium sp. SUN073]
MLRQLGFNDANAGDDAVAILVGPNGSGKSRFLEKIGKHYQDRRPVCVVSNTLSLRLNSLRNAKRFAVGRIGKSPKSVIKAALASTLDRDNSAFYQIRALMEYCQYQPRFGFRKQGFRPDALNDFVETGGNLDSFLTSPEQREDFSRAMDFLGRWPAKEIHWVDEKAQVYEFALQREIASVLRTEAVLTKLKVLKGIQVYVDKGERSGPFEVHNASSGELSLISSLLFLTAEVEPNSIVLIDEPENSLHPSWQRAYVDKVLAALTYRNISVIIATHSPLVVTGALMAHNNLVSVFQMQRSEPQRLRLQNLDSGETSIEAVLWKAFDVVTPANHFISEEVVEAINRFERDEITKGDITAMLQHMKARSFDPRQDEFFNAIAELVKTVEQRKAQRIARGGD